MDGRIEVSYAAGEGQLEQLKTQQGESDLLYKDGQIYSEATSEVEEAEPL